MMSLPFGLQRIPTPGRSIATGMTPPDGSTVQGSMGEGLLALGRHGFDPIAPDLVPAPLVVLLVVTLAVPAFLERTVRGRLICAIGSIARATAPAGTDVDRDRLAASMISGVTASGNDLLLDAVAPR